MQVIKNRQIENIDWEILEPTEDEPLEIEQIKATGNIIFPYDFYQTNKDALSSRTGKIGVIIDGDVVVESIVADLDKLDLIALDFPVYADGRCFSHACLLRDAYQYQGDLLAIGDILRDQVAHLERCGVNLIKLTEHRDMEDALQAFSELSTPYQTSVDHQKTITQLR